MVSGSCAVKRQSENRSSDGRLPPTVRSTNPRRCRCAITSQCFLHEQGPPGREGCRAMRVERQWPTSASGSGQLELGTSGPRLMGRHVLPPVIRPEGAGRRKNCNVNPVRVSSDREGSYARPCLPHPVARGAPLVAAQTGKARSRFFPPSAVFENLPRPPTPAGR